MFNELYNWDIVGKKEAELIEDYRERGWKILNKGKAGGLGSGYRKWTRKAVLEESKKYKSPSDFEKNKPGAYNAALIMKLMGIIKKHNNWKSKTESWTKTKVIKESKKYKILKEFRDKNNKAYSAACRLGIIREVTSHMKQRKMWTESLITKVAKKYKTYADFKKYNNDAVCAASRRGILKKVCSHMKRLHHKPYTEKEIIKKAKEYTKISEFYKKNRSMENAARNLNIIYKIKKIYN